MSLEFLKVWKDLSSSLWWDKSTNKELSFKSDSYCSGTVVVGKVLCLEFSKVEKMMMEKGIAELKSSVIQKSSWQEQQWPKVIMWLDLIHQENLSTNKLWFRFKNGLIKLTSFYHSLMLEVIKKQKSNSFQVYVHIFQNTLYGLYQANNPQNHLLRNSILITCN